MKLCSTSHYISFLISLKLGGRARFRCVIPDSLYSSTAVSTGRAHKKVLDGSSTCPAFTNSPPCGLPYSTLTPQHPQIRCCRGQEVRGGASNEHWLISAISSGLDLDRKLLSPVRPDQFPCSTAVPGMDDRLDVITRPMPMPRRE